MRTNLIVLLVIIVTAAGIILAGCGGGDGGDTPEASPTKTPAVSVTVPDGTVAPPSPGETPPQTVTPVPIPTETVVPSPSITPTAAPSPVPSPTASPTPAVSPTPAPTTGTTPPAQDGISIPDAGLEAVIRAAIGKPTGGILESDLKGITSLDASRKGIRNLSGLQYCTGLTQLNLAYNQIADIKVLTQNNGLGSGDTVRLEFNPLNDVSMNTYIPQLQSRGVDVSWGSLIAE